MTSKWKVILLGENNQVILLEGRTSCECSECEACASGKV